MKHTNIPSKEDICKLQRSAGFWPIYLACLEQPRKLWAISNAYDLMKEGIQKYAHDKEYKAIKPKTRLYNKKAISQMERAGFLKATRTDKGKEYFASLEPLGLDKEYVALLEREWARKSLFAISAIKKFFKFEENGLKEIQKNGGMFLDFVSQLVAIHAITTKLERKGGQGPIIQMLENSCPGIPFYKSIDAFNYKINMRKVLDAHKDEIYKTLKPSIENKDALPS